jgi:ArsR family transcriptional regulator
MTQDLTLTQVRISDDELRLANMLKALGNPIRFKIMETLAERQMCMTYEIVETTPLAQSTVSQHLKVLREAGLIKGEIEGPATCYCIDPDGVLWLKEQIEGWLPDCCLPGDRIESSDGGRNCC